MKSLKSSCKLKTKEKVCWDSSLMSFAVFKVLLLRPKNPVEKPSMKQLYGESHNLRLFRLRDGPTSQ